MNKAEETAYLLGGPKEGDRIEVHFEMSDAVLAGVVVKSVRVSEEDRFHLYVDWENGAHTLLFWPEDPGTAKWMRLLLD